LYAIPGEVVIISAGYKTSDKAGVKGHYELSITWLGDEPGVPLDEACVLRLNESIAASSINGEFSSDGTTKLLLVLDPSDKWPLSVKAIQPILADVFGPQRIYYNTPDDAEYCLEADGSEWVSKSAGGNQYEGPDDYAGYGPV
jgi:hypothetical protein